MVSLLSAYQASEILKALKDGKHSVDVSLDLGRTREKVVLGGEYATLPDGQKVGAGALEGIAGETTCFMVENGAASKIQFFLPDTRRFYRLVATGPAAPPTAEISGVRMHRTKGMDPGEDTRRKIKPLRPLSGRVLDSCTGLGYTAVEALNAGAREVYTVENDACMMRLCELNPWSMGLYDSRVKGIDGDVFDVVKGFGDGFFNAVIHDPPSFSLAGRLYSLEFYRQLHRVLAEGGGIFHYTGQPGSRFRRKDTLAGTMRRLREAGFTDVKSRTEALGVSARK